MARPCDSHTDETGETIIQRCHGPSTSILNRRPGADRWGTALAQTQGDESSAQRPKTDFGKLEFRE